MGQHKASSPDTPENWGAAGRGYSQKVAPLLIHPFAEQLAERLELAGSESVLEVAAGSGALTELLYQKAGSVLATDFAPKMIEILTERMEALGAANVKCRVMDGQALDLEDSSFDAAAASFALMLFPDRNRGFSELCRVVRPGGRVAVSGWAGPDKFEALGIFLEAFKSAFPDMPAPATPPPVFSLSDPDVFRSEMEDAGFSQVEVDFVACDLEVPGFAEMWEMLTVGAPPVQMMFDRIGPEGRDRLKERLREITQSRFGPGPFRFTNVATFGCAVSP